MGGVPVKKGVGDLIVGEGLRYIASHLPSILTTEYSAHHYLLAL